MTQPAIFLDRDGVLNATLADARGLPHPPASLAELSILPGAAAACARLRGAGFALIGVTNQPDLARGTARPSEVAAISARVAEACGLDALLTCPHDDADACDCRKPRPGLLLAAARDRPLDLAASWMVGDRWRDIEAGHAAGVRTILVGPGWPERAPAPPPHHRAADLAAAADLVLGAGGDGRARRDAA